MPTHDTAVTRYSPKGFRSFMLLGSVEAGKSTLLKALLGRPEEVRKTQAVEFAETCVDTPGEYFSHPRFYHALIQTSLDVTCLIYVHPANDVACRLPPGLMDIYSDKELIAVISKTDLPDAQPDAVERILREQGLREKQMRGKVDMIAASLFLQAWLDSHAHGDTLTD